MAVVINRTNWRSPERRLYLWECGTCHSKMLVKYEEFENPLLLSANISQYSFTCPVCGKYTPSVDPDYISDGGIRSLCLYVTQWHAKDVWDYNKGIPAKLVRVKDHDSDEYSYTFRRDTQQKEIEELEELERWFNADSEHTETKENKL